MNSRDESPLERAKRDGVPYVEITVDMRHIEGHGRKIILRSPASAAEAESARQLIQRMLSRAEAPSNSL